MVESVDISKQRGNENNPRLKENHLKLCFKREGENFGRPIKCSVGEKIKKKQH